MVGLDTFVGKSLESTIKENLGEQTFEKIQERVFAQNGSEIACVLEDFQKLDTALKGLFGNEAEEIEKELLNKIVVFDKSGSQQNWVNIVDPFLMGLILEYLGDEDKKNILMTVIDEAKTISDISQSSNIPQTSGYRKINALIQNGLLIPHKFAITPDGKKVRKYKSIFKNIVIEIEKNKINIGAVLCHESLRNSDVLELCQSESKRFI